MPRGTSGAPLKGMGLGLGKADSGNPMKGVGLVVLATLCFASGDVITKHLAATYPVTLIMAARYFVNILALAAVLGPREGAGLWRVQRGGLVAIRGLALAAGSLTVGLALKLMPVGETTAIIYLAPLVVLVLAGPVLGEKVAVFAWVCASLGFLGVLLIARPGSGLNPWGVAFALMNVGFGTTYHLMTRVLIRTETNTALLFHTAVWGFLVLGGLTLVQGAEVWPDLAGLAGMVALGLLASGGHVLFTAAYREAPASLLAPVNYIHLVWAVLLGWLVFSHVPDGWTLLGITMVAAAGLMIALDVARRAARGRAG